MLSPSIRIFLSTSKRKDPLKFTQEPETSFFSEFGSISTDLRPCFASGSAWDPLSNSGFEGRKCYFLEYQYFYLQVSAKTPSNSLRNVKPTFFPSLGRYPPIYGPVLPPGVPGIRSQTVDLTAKNAISVNTHIFIYK